MTEPLIPPTERQKHIESWNEKNKNLPWTVEWSKRSPVRQSLLTQAGQPSPRQIAAVQRQLESQGEPTDDGKKHGMVIYMPHDCKKPDVDSFPVGTIWECTDYAVKSESKYGRSCHDQWILERSPNGTQSRRWALFKRSI